MAARTSRPVLALAAGVICSLAAAGCGASSPTDATAASSVTAPLDLALPWIAASPADVGMDSRILDGAATQAAAIPRCRSLLVARRGRLVLERYFRGTGTETLFDVRSVTKTVVGALTGIAIRDGVLPGLDVSIAGYLDPPYHVYDAERAITLRHLATMTSGFEWEENTGPDFNVWIESDDHVQFLLDRPQAHPPGTFFTYDSAAVHVLGVVLQRASGQPLPTYTAERLFAPLGIERVAWEGLDRGTVDGGSGIQLRGRDLLKLGQLYLQRGTSGSRSVVPEGWVDETTRPRFSWRQSLGALGGVTYGTLWWTSDASPQAYFAWGYGGQFVYVVPSRELVVVATTDWRQLEGAAPALAAQVMSVIVTGVVPAAR